MSKFIEHLKDESGYIIPQAVVDEFQTTIKDLAALSGLSSDALTMSNRFQSQKNQKRLRDIITIIDHVIPCCGTPMLAYVWYREEQIPSFGDLTAEDVVKRDMSDVVLDYIDRIAEGGYA